MEVHIELYNDGLLLGSSSLPSDYTYLSGTSFDFDKVPVGTYTASSIRPKDWTFQNATATTAEIVDSGLGNKYLQHKSYHQFYANYPIYGPYQFSVDVQHTGVNSDNFGMFARASEEKFYFVAPENTYGSSYFEQDRAMPAAAIKGIGATGFYLLPVNNTLSIMVKKYNAAYYDTYPIANEKITFNVGVDFSTGRHRISIKDMGDIIYIYVADQLIAYMTFSDLKSYDRWDAPTSEIVTSQEYFSRLEVYNSKGGRIAVVENTLIAQASRLAIGNRNVMSQIDNIDIRLFDDIKASEAVVSYKGAQIRTSLVPYLVGGEIDESQLRQGLRFCFDDINIDDTFEEDGETYTVTDLGGLVILKDNADRENLTVDNPYKKLINSKDIADYSIDDINYKAVYIYNIPEGHKDTVIYARMYIELTDNLGGTKIMYTDVQEKSLTDVYESMLAAGEEGLLSSQALAWWS